MRSYRIRYCFVLHILKYSQIRKSGIHTNVVIEIEDTDVHILTAYITNINKILTITRKHNIINCRILCQQKIPDIIIPLPIHSGSDTTTVFFAHGKTTIVEKGASSEYASSLLKSTGMMLPVTQAVLDDVAMFTIREARTRK